ARLRSEPELKDEDLAIFEGNGNAARVVAASRKARKAGVETGMTLPQARARIPKLIARGRDRECERAAQQSLLEVAESFSPRIEDAGEGVAYADLEGHAKLAGGGGPATNGRPSAVGDAVRRTAATQPRFYDGDVGAALAAAQDLARDI